jgi:hypothetical protein
MESFYVPKQYYSLESFLVFSSLMIIQGVVPNRKKGKATLLQFRRLALHCSEPTNSIRQDPPKRSDSNKDFSIYLSSLPFHL